MTNGGREHRPALSARFDLGVGLDDIYDTEVTDRGLKYLTGLASLETLFLYDTNVSNEGVKKLQRALPNCEIRH